MKRIIKQIAVLLLGIVLATSVSWAKGYDNDLKLRVGIFYGSKAKSSYRIGGSQLFVVAGGRVVLSTGASEMQVSKAGTIYHSPESYASYEEASSGGKMVYYNNGAFYKVSEFYTAGYQPNSDANILIRANDGRSLVLLGGVDQYIESGNGIVSIEGVQYREKAHVLHDGKKIIAINIVGLDYYLKGVVPKEMPPNWHIEALKAQSVVARNYVLTNVNKHVSEGFHVCNTTNCQVYGGASAQTPMTDLAVELTSGELMYYGGGVVEGYFHASSGGQTETSTNIWGSAWRPYLTGQSDPFSLGGPYDLWSVTMSSEEIRRQLANSGVNIGQVVGLSITQVSPNGRVMELVVHGSGGSHALKKERIRTVLGSNKLKSIFFTLQGSARVAGASIASSGRPSDKAAKTSLDDLFKDLSAVLDKQAAQKKEQQQALPKTGSPGSAEQPSLMQQPNLPQPNLPQPNIPQGVPSAPMTIPIQGAGVYGSSFTFVGRGYGHGVGMSQYGAKGMAERGYNYHQILQYYFQGVVIGRS